MTNLLNEKELKILYFIPARSGSKGVSNKNIKILGKRPLMSYVIDACLQSRYKGTVYVSTDSAEYAKIAESCGATVPFLRPSQLATDSSVVTDAVLDAVEQFRKHNVLFDILALVQPTSPFITSYHIDQIFKDFIDRQANAVVTLTESECPLEWMGHISEDLSMSSFSINTAIRELPRQQLQPTYKMTGSIRIADMQYYMKTRGDWYGPNCYGFPLPREISLDIDDEFDWLFAEFMFDCQNENVDNNKP